MKARELRELIQKQRSENAFEVIRTRVLDIEKKINEKQKELGDGSIFKATLRREINDLATLLDFNKRLLHKPEVKTEVQYKNGKYTRVEVIKDENTEKTMLH